MYCHEGKYDMYYLAGPFQKRDGHEVRKGEVRKG